MFRDFELRHAFQRVNCVEIAGDRPKQFAYEIFSIKRKF